jgi:hypothetical protein
MRRVFGSFAVVMSFALAMHLVAEEKEQPKEVTLKGKLVCGKCTLKETDACANVLQVTGEDKKTVNYYLQDKGRGETYHRGICPPGSSKEATVTGAVGKQGEKMVIKASKVEVK